MWRFGGLCLTENLAWRGGRKGRVLGIRACPWDMDVFLRKGGRERFFLKCQIYYAGVGGGQRHQHHRGDGIQWFDLVKPLTKAYQGLLRPTSDLFGPTRPHALPNSISLSLSLVFFLSSSLSNTFSSSSLHSNSLSALYRYIFPGYFQTTA